MVTDDVSVQHKHLPRCNGLRGKQNKTLACPARQIMFWAESSQCNSPLFKRVAWQVKVLAGQINLRGSFPARQVMFWNLCCTLDVYIVFTCVQLLYRAAAVAHIFVPVVYSGFDIPRGPGANAPRFCCGPLDFSV